MKAWWTVVLLAAAGGCTSHPTKLAGDGAVLTAVAADQQFAAVLTGTTRLSTGARTGVLEAVPVSGGERVMLDGNSSGGVYDRGSYLWFLGGVSVVSEGTPTPYPHVYGHLSVWFPGMPAPARVGTNVREYYPSQNGAGCVFIDWDQQSIAATNTGKLIAVAAASCASGTCQPITIESGVTQLGSSWRISSDGRWVLATTRGATLTDPGKAVLIDLTTGQTQTLSQGVAPRSAMMTPDGATIAWVEGANRIVVASTASPMAQSALTSSAPLVESAQMIDANNFVAKTRAAATGPAGLEKLSSAGSTPLTVPKVLELYVSQYVPGTTSRYLFFTETAQGSGDQDLWLYDLQATNPQPVQLAMAIDTPLGSSIAFSDDGASIHYLDNYDPTTRRGDEYVVTLAMPVRNLVATGLHAAAFIPDSTRLLYVNAPDASTGAGVLTLLPAVGKPPEVEGVGLVNFVDSRAAPLRTYYTQLTGGSDDGVWYMGQP